MSNPLYVPAASLPPITNRLKFSPYSLNDGEPDLLTNRSKFLSVDARNAVQIGSLGQLRQTSVPSAAIFDECATATHSISNVKNRVDNMNTKVSNPIKLLASGFADTSAAATSKYIKPKGEAGRGSSRGFNLRNAVGWEVQVYRDVQVWSS
jgi:hypothetical protein